MIYVRDKALTDMFFSNNWPKPHTNRRMAASSEADDGIQLGELLQQIGGSGGGAEPRYLFENIDGFFSYQYQRGKEDPRWIRLCNFEMVDLKTLYIFRDQKAGPPTQRILVRRHVNSQGEGTLRVTPEDQGCIRNLTHHQFLEVEVLVSAQQYKTQDEVRKVFSSAHGALEADCLTVEMLNVWVSSQMIEKGPNLKTELMVSYFGRQFDENTFVAGNCAVSLEQEFIEDEGREFPVTRSVFRSLEDARVAVMPKHFIEALVPIGIREFPQIMVIQQPWIRYAIGMNLWVNSMPEVFLNNTMAAKAVFAAGVMGLFAGKIWDGDHGVIGGMPFVWAHSPEHHTGKTTAAVLVNAMLGLHRRGIWAGDATKAALFERISQQSCLSVCIDDIVIKADQNESKMMAQFGRAIYDRTSRATQGKVRFPESSCIFTANTTINDTDSAFVSRMLMILFAPLMSHDDGGAAISDNFRALTELSSSLIVDFASILWNDHLDGEAIQDCGRWIGTAIGRARDRSAQNWGLLTYFMLAITFMFQGGRAQVEEVLDWVVRQVTRTAYEMQHHSGKLDQFILAVNKVRTVASSNPLTQENKVIFHHNFRTAIRPEGALGTMNFYALRVEAVCNVIKEVLGLNFKPNEIQTAVEFVDWARYGRGSFYDCTSNPWPISKAIFVNETQTMHNVPLPEDELLESTLSRMRCLFIRAPDFDKIISDVERGSALPHDPKQVVISSSNQRFNAGQRYCFYETVTGNGNIAWFGWRFAAHCTFSDMCYTNVVNIGGPTTDLEINAPLEAYNMRCGFPEISDCYQPPFIYQFFKEYNVNADPDRLPPCFKFDPFSYKNDKACLYTMPRVLFHAGETPPSSPSNDPSTEYSFGSPAPSRRVADELAEGLGANANGSEDPGSNPYQASLYLRDVSNVASSPIGTPQRGNSSYAIPKRRRVAANRFVAGEVEVENDSGDEVRLPSIYPTHCSRLEPPS